MAAKSYFKDFRCCLKYKHICDNESLQKPEYDVPTVKFQLFDLKIPPSSEQ